MRAFLHALSPRTEFAIVVLGAFGYFAAISIEAFLYPGIGVDISEDGLQFLLIYEAFLLIVLGSFLFARGWDLRQLGSMPTLRDTGMGFALALVAYAVYAVVWIIFGNLVPAMDDKASGLVTTPLQFSTVIAISLLNPIFEEIFVCGYVITALKRTRGVLLAINVSVGIRLAYHLYQGPAGIVSIIPLGLVFGYWFARTGRLWPVIVAHAIFDFAALAVHVRS
jgi:membrane protease YdiL (CAAX protease family)